MNGAGRPTGAAGPVLLSSLGVFVAAHDIHADLNLGWVKAPRDPRNLTFAQFTTPELPAPPPKVNWMSRVPGWPLYGNNRIGNCEVCACAHAVQAFTAYGAGREVIIPEPDVIAAYSAITGYNPATGQPDPGITSLDMLGHWRKNGVGGHRITAYVEVDVRDRDEVKSALSVGGALLVGADMPLSAGDQFKASRKWTVQRGTRGRAGSWGGHALHIGAYGGRGLTCTTWGTTQELTWGWWDRYVVEAFVPISTEWFNQAGQSPTGLDINALLADLQRIAAG